MMVKEAMTEEKKEQPKLCPFMTANLPDRREYVSCLKEKCALWVEMTKPAPNPFYVLRYHGCGLIATVPWDFEKRETPKQREVTKSE